MKTPLTRGRLKQHFTYSLWKYLLMAVIVVFGWNIVYTVTAYRPPKEKIVDLYIYGYAEPDPLTEYMESVRQTEMPDMEQMTCALLPMDEQYGMMALSTRVAAGEGDLYIVPRDVFQNTAGEGWYMPLDDDAELQAFCEAHSISLDRCWRRDSETGERHLYGIPLAALPGVAEHVYATDEYFLTVLYNNGNTENVVKFLHILLRDMGPDAAAEPAQ